MSLKDHWVQRLTFVRIVMMLLWWSGENRGPWDERGPVAAGSQGLSSALQPLSRQPSHLPLLPIKFMISSTNSVVISLDKRAQ